MPAHNEDSLNKIAARAAKILEFELTANFAKQIVESAQTDARKLINTIEYLHQNNCLTPEGLSEYHTGYIPYDKSGDMHYDFASAMIKSLRGSDPDASLFYAFKMLEAGEDPRFIFRRLIIFASEDIGNADPNALRLAVTAAEAFERVGMPEGRIPLAQAITYLASCPKSNRSYIAMHKVIDAIQQNPTATPPLHLQNAPTKLMKKQGRSVDYQYPHDDPKGYIAGVEYLPEKIKNLVFYEPSNHGAEAKISERLKLIRSARNK
jgi:putative ATPase